jgi:hypothetical protein
MEWLIKLLQGQQGGGGAFGALGGTPPPSAMGPQQPMPAPTMGPGAPAGPGAPLGLLNRQQPQGQPGQGQNNQAQLAQILGAFKQPQIQPATFSPMMPMGTMRG